MPARRRLTVALTLAVVAGVSLADASQPAPPRPTLQQLQSATVSGIYRTAITLAAGKYEGPPVAQGAVSRPRVVLWSNLVAFGDLDNVPGDEAAILLGENSGGSGAVVYLAVMAVREGRLVNIATIAVGDRVRVRTIAVNGGHVVLDVVEAGPTDAMCCPTQLATKTYALEGGALRLLSSNVTGTLSIATLGGAPWVVVDIDGKPLPAGVEPPRIVFDGARVSGFDGCNRFTGEVREQGPGAFQFGPLAATRMACPPPAGEVEHAFSVGLAAVTQYTFLAGRLVLSGADRQAMGRLTLER